MELTVRPSRTSRRTRIRRLATLLIVLASATPQVTAQNDCDAAKKSTTHVETPQQKTRRQAVEKKRNERRDRHWDVQSRETRKRMRQNNRYARRQARGKSGPNWLERLFHPRTTPWHLRLRSRAKSINSGRRKTRY